MRYTQRQLKAVRRKKQNNKRNLRQEVALLKLQSVYSQIGLPYVPINPEEQPAVERLLH